MFIIQICVARCLWVDKQLSVKTAGPDWNTSVREDRGRTDDREENISSLRYDPDSPKIEYKLNSCVVVL